MVGASTSKIFTDRRALFLVAVIAVQTLTALFFVADVVRDVLEDGRVDGVHMWFEAIAAGALIAGGVVLMIELRRFLGRMATMERATRAARGEMADVIAAFFDVWALTPSERDVALMVLKGIDNETIAQLRGTAAGTVRAQCTSIYAKARVDGRAQLVSVFLEELLADDGAAGAQGAARTMH